ncbi:hypothetical protein N5079_35295, partial [Planotetraspora sp. A-T 1434]|uniref:hypothetical protein n=1 Tax=Planotetraspora sp. A-T 1434 TaxID=2979219 RepID=UPI0021C161C4
LAHRLTAERPTAATAERPAARGPPAPRLAGPVGRAVMGIVMRGHAARRLAVSRLAAGEGIVLGQVLHVI